MTPPEPSGNYGVPYNTVPGPGLSSILRLVREETRDQSQKGRLGPPFSDLLGSHKGLQPSPRERTDLIRGRDGRKRSITKLLLLVSYFTPRLSFHVVPVTRPGRYVGEPPRGPTRDPVVRQPSKPGLRRSGKGEDRRRRPRTPIFPTRRTRDGGVGRGCRVGVSEQKIQDQTGGGESDRDPRDVDHGEDEVRPVPREVDDPPPTHPPDFRRVSESIHPDRRDGGWSVPSQTSETIASA